MEEQIQTHLEILSVDVIDYSEICVEYAIKCSVSGDLLSVHRNTFNYYQDAYTSSFKKQWEIWAGGDMQVLVQVKYGRNGLVEEFIKVEELEYC